MISLGIRPIVGLVLRDYQAEVYRRENCTFSDGDIIKFYSYYIFLTPLTPLTWIQKVHQEELTRKDTGISPTISQNIGFLNYGRLLTICAL